MDVPLVILGSILYGFVCYGMCILMCYHAKSGVQSYDNDWGMHIPAHCQLISNSPMYTDVQDWRLILKLIFKNPVRSRSMSRRDHPPALHPPNCVLAPYLGTFVHFVHFPW